MKTWYFKLSQDNTILDVVEYPAEGYIEVQLEETHLPAGINGGWWKLENAVPVEYPELKPKTENEEIAELKARQEETELAIMELSMLLGGAE